MSAGPRRWRPTRPARQPPPRGQTDQSPAEPADRRESPGGRRHCRAGRYQGLGRPDFRCNGAGSPWRTVSPACSRGRTACRPRFFVAAQDRNQLWTGRGGSAQHGQPLPSRRNSSGRGSGPSPSPTWQGYLPGKPARLPPALGGRPRAAFGRRSWLGRSHRTRFPHGPHRPTRRQRGRRPRPGPGGGQSRRLRRGNQRGWKPMRRDHLRRHQRTQQ